jgi:hypothetical protein
MEDDDGDDGHSAQPVDVFAVARARARDGRTGERAVAVCERLHERAALIIGPPHGNAREMGMPEKRPKKAFAE